MDMAQCDAHERKARTALALLESAVALEQGIFASSCAIASASRNPGAVRLLLGLAREKMAHLTNLDRVCLALVTGNPWPLCSFEGQAWEYQSCGDGVKGPAAGLCIEQTRLEALIQQEELVASLYERALAQTTTWEGRSMFKALLQAGRRRLQLLGGGRTQDKGARGRLAPDSCVPVTTTGRGKRSQMEDYQWAAELTEIPPGSVKYVQVGGKHMLLVNIDKQIYAVDNYCTHSRCFLHNGSLKGKVITCPCHFAEFDVTTGEVIAAPAKTPLATYRAKRDGNDILVAV